MDPRSGAPAQSTVATSPQLAMTLHEIAWATHRRAPERADVGPIPTRDHAAQAGGRLPRRDRRRAGPRAGPRAVAALQALSDRGIVARGTSAEDRRVVRLRPTAAGTAEHEAIAEAWTSAIVRSVEAL